MKKRVCICVVMSVILGAGMLSAAPSKSKNLLKNADFKDSRTNIKPWNFNYVNHGDASYKVVPGGVIRIVTKSPSSLWYLCLAQPVDLKNGKKYKLSFDARTEAKEKPTIFVKAYQSGRGEKKGESVQFMKTAKRVDLTDEWTPHGIEFIADGVVKEGKNFYKPAVIFLLGLLDGDVLLRKVSLVEVKSY